MISLLYWLTFALASESAEATAALEQSPATEGCFLAHVVEAMALNTARKPMYAALSGGSSLSLSERLIALERATMPIARAMDARAAVFQKRGIPVMCAEFVPMTGAGEPEFHLPLLPPPAPGELNGLDMAFRLAGARARGRYEAMAREANTIIAELARHPDYACMTRHLLESVRRAATLAPTHVATARQLGFRFRTPEPLSRVFLALQVDALPAAAQLDLDAAQTQALGTPIFCRDLPPIDSIP